MSLSTSFPLASRQWQRQFLVSPRKLPRRSCAYSVHACWAKFWDSSLDSLKKKDEDFSCHKNVYVVFFLYKWYHSFYGSFDHHTTPSYTVSHKITMVSSRQRRHAAGRGWYRRRDLVRLGRTENPSKSQLSHFFENDNKWVLLQHHVFSPLEQKNKCCRGCGTKVHF